MMPDRPLDHQPIDTVAKSDPRQACEDARALVSAQPDDEHAALLLRDAVRHYAGAIPQAAAHSPEVNPAVAEARELLAAGKAEEAEILLRRYLKTGARDPAAMHTMAEIAAQCGLREDSERILRESARLHVASADAWFDLAATLYRIALRKDYPDYVHRAVAALDEALKLEPGHEPALAFKGSMLVQTRGMELALETFETLIPLNPRIALYWLNYGFVLKTIGRFGDSVAAYRTAIALDPKLGAAWWSLANLKTARFFETDIAEMEAILAAGDLPDYAKVEVSFALAKALDQHKRYEQAAGLLDRGGKLRTALQVAETDIVTGDSKFVKSLFTRAFVDERRDWGDPRPDAIFILGMPRSGSTLVEQILSSHPAIEGTEELFILHQLSMELAARFPGKAPAEIIGSLGRSDFGQLGARYLEIAGRSRRTERPFFTDKNPSNWRQIGLIHCMLPNAKIIDVRRNPMDCCFANYAQHFQAGGNYSYDQTRLGSFYRDYVLAMRHFDAALPGTIHRVIHDDLVDDLETEVRRLLDYLGLPFDERCLRYYETERTVHTPSSEQVRQPINRAGFGKWRNYEPWLEDLTEALGDTLNDWRG
jgi:tetratricopeptide (TPR) repeat protein